MGVVPDIGFLLQRHGQSEVFLGDFENRGEKKRIRNGHAPAPTSTLPRTQLIWKGERLLSKPAISDCARQKVVQNVQTSPSAIDLTERVPGQSVHAKLTMTDTHTKENATLATGISSRMGFVSALSPSRSAIVAPKRTPRSSSRKAKVNERSQDAMQKKTYEGLRAKNRSIAMRELRGLSNSSAAELTYTQRFMRSRGKLHASPAKQDARSPAARKRKLKSPARDAMRRASHKLRVSQMSQTPKPLATTAVGEKRGESTEENTEDSEAKLADSAGPSKSSEMSDLAEKVDALTEEKLHLKQQLLQTNERFDKLHNMLQEFMRNTPSKADITAAAAATNLARPQPRQLDFTPKMGTSTGSRTPSIKDSCECPAKYLKLKKMGMPVEQIKLKMERDGIDPGLLESATESNAASTSSCPVPPPLPPTTAMAVAAASAAAKAGSAPSPPQIKLSALRAAANKLQETKKAKRKKKKVLSFVDQIKSRGKKKMNKALVANKPQILADMKAMLEVDVSAEDALFFQRFSSEWTAKFEAVASHISASIVPNLHLSHNPTPPTQGLQLGCKPDDSWDHALSCIKMKRSKEQKERGEEASNHFTSNDVMLAAKSWKLLYWTTIFSQWIGQLSSFAKELRTVYANGNDISRSKMLSRFQQKLKIRRERDIEIFSNSSFARDVQNMQSVGLPVKMLQQERAKALSATAHVAAASLHIAFTEGSAFLNTKRFLRRAKAAGVMAILEQCLEIAHSAEDVATEMPEELDVIGIKVNANAWRSRIDEAKKCAEALLCDEEGSDGDSSDDDAV